MKAGFVLSVVEVMPLGVEVRPCVTHCPLVVQLGVRNGRYPQSSTTRTNARIWGDCCADVL